MIFILSCKKDVKRGRLEQHKSSFNHLFKKTLQFTSLDHSRSEVNFVLTQLDTLSIMLLLFLHVLKLCHRFSFLTLK